MQGRRSTYMPRAHVYHLALARPLRTTDAQQHGDSVAAELEPERHGTDP
jgi:hypothetical protein